MSIIDLLFKDKTDNIFLQFFRYQFVGGVAFLVDFGLFVVFTGFGIHYLLSGVFAFVVSVVVNYVLSTYWAFNPDKTSNSIVEFNLFLIISIIGLVFTEVLLFVFTEYLKVYFLYSKIISTIIVMFWNFGARRFLIYNSKLSKNS